jgi:predicted RNA methylase
MIKLSKQEARLHQDACKILEKDVLAYDEKLFVLENWQEGAVHFNNLVGAFFTPQALASEFAIEMTGVNGTVIDLCAGIGSLAFAVLQHNSLHPPKITCIEINSDYGAVGKKIVPEATWIVADVFNLPPDIGKFDFAIANPPFGRIAHCQGKAPRYSGSEFEYKVMDIASDLANDGVFLIPQASASFEFSGRQGFQAKTSDKYVQLVNQTGIKIGANCGIDTTMRSEMAWRENCHRNCEPELPASS